MATPKELSTLKKVQRRFPKAKGAERKRIIEKWTYIGNDGLRRWKYSGGRVAH